jgi:hypothetical protein
MHRPNHYPRLNQHRPAHRTTPRHLEQLESRLLFAAISWDGGPTGTGTNFLDPVNWAGDTLPGPSDDALIPAGPTITLSGSISLNSLNSSRPITQTAGTFTLASDSSLTQFSLQSGTLTGSGNITINNGLTWTGGSITGTGILSVTGASSIQTIGSSPSLGRTMNLGGTTTHAANTSLAIGLDRPGILNITGTYIFSGTSSNISVNTLHPANIVNLTGTLQRAGTSLSTLAVPLSLSGGIIDVPNAAATLRLSAGGTLDAPSTLTGSGRLALFAGTLTASSTLTGNGSFETAGGTVSGTGSLNLAGIHQSGGTFGGAVNATVNTSFSFTGGTLTGTGTTTIAQTATGTVQTVTATPLLARTLAVDGTISHLANTSMTFGSGTPGQLNISATATYLFSGTSAQLSVNSVLAGNGVNLAGTLRRTDSGISNLGIPLNLIGGNVDVTHPTGAIRLNAGGTLTDPSTVTGSGRLTLLGGTLTVSSDLTGNGTFETAGGTVSGIGTITLSALHITGGNLSGSVNATANTAFTFTGGSMTGTGITTIAQTASGTIQSIASSPLLARPLVIHGSISHLANTSLAVGSVTPGQITISPTGTYILNGTSSQIAVNSILPGNAITVEGILRKSDASFSNIGIPLLLNGGNLDVVDTAGSIRVLAGGTVTTPSTLTGAGRLALFSGALTADIPSAITGPGHLEINGGTLTGSGNISLNTLTVTSGLLTGALNITALTSFRFNGGAMTGTGTTTVAQTATGTIQTITGSPALARPLIVDGTVTHAANTSLSFGSATPGMLSISPTGTYRLSGTSANMSVGAAATGNGIHVAGTLTKSDSSTSFIDVPLNLIGGTVTVTNASGRLRAQGGGTLSAPSSLLGTGRLVMAGSTFTSSSDLAGDGNLEIAAGTITGSGHLSVGGIIHTGGTFGGAVNATANATFSLFGGTLSGTGTTTLAELAIGTIQTINSTPLLARTLLVSGNVTHAANTTVIFGATTPGQIHIASSGTYTLNGSNIAFNENAVLPQNSILVSGTFQKSGTATNSIAIPLTLTDGQVLINSGTLTLQRAATHTGTFHIAPTARLNLEQTHTFSNAFTRGQGTLLIRNTVNVAPATPVTIELGSLLFNSASSRLNLATSDLILHYTSTSPISTLIDNYLADQLTTNPTFANLPTTLAISEAADLGLTDFAGLPVDESTVIAKFTYVGDANLDGQVDALDYERVDLAIGNTNVSGTAQGDLNYDGQVDALDYEQVDLNIGNGVGSPLAAVSPSAIGQALSHSQPHPAPISSIFSSKKIAPLPTLWA